MAKDITGTEIEELFFECSGKTTKKGQPILTVDFVYRICFHRILSMHGLGRVPAGLLQRIP